MSKNIMIPLSLLERAIELLDGIEVYRYGCEFEREYESILREMKKKMQRIELRKAYARIISAEDGEARVRARFQYLRQKSLLGKVGMNQ